MKRPVVELSDCIRCEVCRECCPEVFRMTDSGFVEVAELSEYPEDEVNEAIKNCPADCIGWEDDEKGALW
ncbi:MAG TPA: ferredoxin [Desulfobacterales bacterium]|nr:ferredoxin [Desulfobacterales bacterium]